MPLSESELILNPDGSIYHLNLLPEDIATTIITVGDPDRVSEVSQCFDSLEIKKGKREFMLHTGYLGSKRLSVISTGIGTDNIDIVFNELDALVNVDLKTREIKSDKTVLNFIRIGTSGALQADIPVDTFLISEIAIGFDGLLHFYDSEQVQDQALAKALQEHLGESAPKVPPYSVAADNELLNLFTSNRIRFGITLTNAGFYGPQGRRIRIGMKAADFNQNLADFVFEGKRITNLEMETAGIFGLAKLLNHRAVSLNAILANRATGEFSTTPQKTVKSLIEYTLDTIIKEF